MASRIFFDTAPIIYFLDKSPLYYERVRDFLHAKANADSQFYTSVITDMEYSVMPYREKRSGKIENYNAFLDFLAFKKIDISSEISDLAGKLRAKYEFLKALDALQIAACLFFDCDIFVTNDKSLLQVKELKTAVAVYNI